jgi:hypothetical protein
MTFQDISNTPMGPMGQTGEREWPDLLWIDQLSQEMLLTAQAFQQLRAAFTGRFITRTD